MGDVLSEWDQIQTPSKTWVKTSQKEKGEGSQHGGNSHLQRQAFLSLRTAGRLWYCGRCLPLLRPLRSPNGGHGRTEQGYSSKLTENTITCGEAVHSNGAISKCKRQAESKLSCPWCRGACVRSGRWSPGRTAMGLGWSRGEAGRHGL